LCTKSKSDEAVVPRATAASQRTLDNINACKLMHKTLADTRRNPALVGDAASYWLVLTKCEAEAEGF